MAREYIKVLKYYYIIIFTVVVGGFIASIIHWNYIARDYISTDITTEIEPVMINGDEGWGYLRSSVFYKKNGFIPTSILIAADCDESILEKLHIQKNTLKGKSHTRDFDLYELAYPYQLSKKRNSDTIVIKKEDCLLKFLMLEYDGPYK